MRLFIVALLSASLWAGEIPKCSSILEIQQEIETYEFLLQSITSLDLKNAIQMRLDHWYKKLEEHVTNGR